MPPCWSASVTGSQSRPWKSLTTWYCSQAGIIAREQQDPLIDTAADHNDDYDNASTSNTAQSIASKQDHPNSGTLMLDATVAEQQIAYPTDLKLLNEGRQQWEGI